MRIKKTIVTKDIQSYTVNEKIVTTHHPISGDVAIFEIVTLGKHETVQGEEKRNVAIFEGDFIMAAFADRYATSQFEGYVPAEPLPLYDILAAGGAVGVVKSKNYALKDIEPTKVRIVGYVCDEKGKVINSRWYKKQRVSFSAEIPNNAKVILSIGSTMDSGKTTTAGCIARGLKRTGKRVAFMKFTGTVHTKDRDFVYDAGADVVTDFSDMGFPSTYMADKEELLDLYESLLAKLYSEKPDYIVVEIADGLLQRETNFLLNSKEFISTINSVVFSCGDSLSAFQGIEVLNELHITPAFLSGRFTMSPLLIQEVQEHSGMPVLDMFQIMSGEFNDLLISHRMVVAA
ncbi:MAG: hypothetical protein H0W62_07850 [Chitinophagales bacterium]|nr:hypothetical protein [Chitinophagales bacterium]